MRSTDTLLKGWFVIAVTAAVACLSCSENNRERQPAATAAFQAGQYRIEFSLPGDDFASIQELENINRIKERIVRQAAGEVLSTGSGMGTITLLVKFQDRESLKVIEAIIQQEYPNARYLVVPDRRDSGNPEEQ